MTKLALQPTLATMARSQLTLTGFDPIEAALQILSTSGVEARGAIFTRREVVDFILDLIGYTPDRDLRNTRLLEPAFGNGDFLLAVIERLLASCERHNKDTEGMNFDALENAIRAIELHGNTFTSTHERVASLLAANNFPNDVAERLLSSWLHQGDFLLTDLKGGFDFVVGNPPYLRQELIPDALINEYRRRYQTIFDRADIYVPFIERSLALLAPRGTLGFICADRWMKNRYGGPLRRFVAQDYHLKYHIDMTDTAAFHSDVIAYPAISVISRETSGPTRVAYRPKIGAEELSSLSEELKGKGPSPRVKEFPLVLDADAPWILESSNRLALVRALEARFPTLEEAGCKVGIGVATGADQVFIAPFAELDVEPDRKLPLVMTRDIESGSVTWRGYGVLNPFGDDGKLVPLQDFPRLAKYLNANGAAIKARHVSKKNPNGWYRTIDRIYPALTNQPKLLIPDIKGEAHIVYEEGRYYPHHNLYFITSETWDLRALEAILKSGIARLFVSTYATKMRGGYLRFQAQYLRRIRVPLWSNVSTDVRAELKEAGMSNDADRCNDAVAHLYGLNAHDRSALAEKDS